MSDNPSSFIDLFCHSAGKVKYPKKYIYWSGLALVAAALQNRVFTQEVNYSRLYPNLYVFLIGPSGSGKTQSMEMTSAVLMTAIRQYGALLNPYYGPITHAAIRDELKDGPLFLNSFELSEVIRTGELGQEMINTLTSLYDVHGYAPSSERTRTRGKSTIIEPCITWLAGTTDSALVRSVHKEDILSGFFGRVCPVIVHYGQWLNIERSWKRRKEREDTSEFKRNSSRLAAWLARLAHQDYKDELRLSQEGRDVFYEWRDNRPECFYETVSPTYVRIPLFAMKLAMIHHMAQLPEHHTPSSEGGSWWFIGPEAMRRAIKDAESLLTGAMYFIEDTVLKEENPGLAKAIRFLSNRTIVDPGLVRRKYKTAREFNEIRDQLFLFGYVKEIRNKSLNGSEKVLWEWVPEKER